MSEFDPYAIMHREYIEANRKRLRIVSWQINPAAEHLFLAHPYSQTFNPMRSPNAREFRGIPFEFVDDGSDAPALAPRYDKRGHALLVHDYDGPIRHGNEMARWLDAGMKALEIVKAERREKEKEEPSR